MKVSYWFLFLAAAIVGCSQKESNTLTLVIKSDFENGEPIQVITLKNLAEHILVESKLDSTSQALVEFELEKPTIAYVRIGNKYSEVYLTPGSKMEAWTSQSGSPIKFTGDGADVNNYLAEVMALVETAKMRGGKYIAQLDAEPFLDRVDSIKSDLDGLYNRYTDSLKFPQHVQSILERKKNLTPLLLKQEYAFLLLNNSLDSKAQEALPKEFAGVVDEVFFDKEFIELGVFEYDFLIQYYLMSKFHDEYLRNTQGKDTYKHLSSKTNAAIMEAKIDPNFKEYLQAKNTLYFLTMEGITPSNDSVFTELQNSIPESNYLPTLQKVYNEWLAIGAGKAAPDLSGTTIDGKTIHLSSLKDKIVFVDVWATWCAPCKEQLPDLKRIQAEFENEDRVEFLYISIDRDKEAWKEMIKNDKSWKGLHIIQNEIEIESFWKAYKIAGVPAYMLIDREGVIVEAKALRPSEGKLAEQIRGLLEKI